MTDKSHQSSKVQAEERRLGKAFGPLLLLALGAPAAGAACMTGAPDSSGTSSTSNTSSLTARDGRSTDGGGDDGGVVDAGPGVDIFDGGPCGLQTAPEPSDSDAGDCADFKTAACGLPSDYVSIADGCFLSLSQCYAICHRLMRPCHAYGDSCVNNQIVTDRPVLVECAICPGNVGRRPEGFDPTMVSEQGAAPLGAFFAELARLEAASIDAFDRLKDELVAHGAPAELVACAERSRQDEVEHARMMTRLARRHGSMPTRVATRGPRQVRPLVDIARENMVEGCIRETFGALIAAWQASHSADPEIASALERIAEDELRHAALSWAVSEWSASALSEEERAGIASARESAIAELLAEAERPLHSSLVEVAGLPSGELQKQMIDGLRTSLWAA